MFYIYGYMIFVLIFGFLFHLCIRLYMLLFVALILWCAGDSFRQMSCGGVGGKIRQRLEIYWWKFRNWSSRAIVVLLLLLLLFSDFKNGIRGLAGVTRRKSSSPHTDYDRLLLFVWSGHFNLFCMWNSSLSLSISYSPDVVIVIVDAPPSWCICWKAAACLTRNMFITIASSRKKSSYVSPRDACRAVLSTRSTTTTNHSNGIKVLSVLGDSNES